MKKLLIMLLAACLMLTPVFTACAEGTETEFNSEFYTVTLPEGQWYSKAGAEGLTFFYDTPEPSLDYGMVMCLTQDIDIGGLQVTDAMLSAWYDSMVTGIAASAVDGKVEQEDGQIVGRLSRRFLYDQQVNGMTFRVAGECIMIDGHIIAICYFNAEKNDAELKETVNRMSESLVYKGE